MKTLNKSLKKAEQKQKEKERVASLLPKPAPEGKPYYDSFDAYVRNYPEGERFRAWLTNNGRNPVVMLLMSKENGAPHSGMPGHYLAVSFYQFNDEILLNMHDCDDGLAQRRWPVSQRQQAEQVLEDMKKLAPFTMWEAAEHFGLSWD